MRYAIVTFGCRVNQADSLRLEEDLRAGGNVESSCERADLVIVNTCSVTASADQGARQTIRRIARQNPSARIVATGCYATRSPGEVAALPGVVRVVRNEEKFDFLRGEGATFRPDATTADRADGDGPCGAPIEPGVAGRTAFTLRVQSGCEERCSYCIIPTTRGASRSVPIDGVLGEVGRVAGAGFKEVALTGVHLGSYGRDLTPPSSLYALLRALDDVPDDVRFRISSLEPMDCRREIVDLVVASGRFLPHFHLPLQHASNRMLRLMQRPYRLEDYRGLVDDIRARLPHAAIGSDMIVGFPGETDDDFAANLEYLPPSPLTHLHVFPYSDRPGTAASTMRDKVAAPVIRDRGSRVRAISADLTRRFRESQAGTIRPGLTLEDGTLVVTDNYLKVRIPQEYRRNERLMVWICEVRGELVGRVV
ncbi:MAG: tRNA (N(6)-L-threonylcarbamoyladenosine(37)-C(2))-methylthiotransferase MtaB [Acidobacteria bacterium]|nr:MAG: tRNA (N(6)-L-threonylcarbamoyladenosine(37)-C(2))-methylthiotransferase MtaB [Acidobacteriota bacterium]